MRYTFFPSTDSLLLGWSLNFKTILTAAPATYGVTSAQCVSYGTLHSNFATALAACDPNVRNKSAVVSKNEARRLLKDNARLLANLVNGTATVTDAQKIALGLNVRAQPQPIPVPKDPPVLEVEYVRGRIVRLNLKATTDGKKGKPAGVQGAAIFSYVGDSAPTGNEGWRFEGNTTQRSVDIQFDNTVAGGAQVWFTAFWYNPRAQSGPAAVALSTYLQGGNNAPNGQTMQIAA